MTKQDNQANGSALAIQRRMGEICATATEDKCKHRVVSQQYSRRGKSLNIAVMILTAVTSSALFGNLYENFPTQLTVLGLALGLAALVCSILQAALQHTERASRHCELASCFESLANTCSTTTARFEEKRLGIKEFDSLLLLYKEQLNELHARASDLVIPEGMVERCEL